MDPKSCLAPFEVDVTALAERLQAAASTDRVGVPLDPSRTQTATASDLNVGSNGSGKSVKEEDDGGQAETLRMIAAAYMVACGKSSTEVAHRLGVHVNTVYRWRGNPKFKRRVIDILKEAGADGVRDLVIGAAPENVLTLIHLRDTSTDDRVKAMCAIHLWDRYAGKVGEPMEFKPPAEDPIDEAQKLEKQIATLEKQIASRVPPPVIPKGAASN